jgi:hypothetical protein
VTPPELALDKILAEAGLTREEWQKARRVVEDYWRPFAEMNGWSPSGAKSQQPVVVQLPLRPGSWLRLEMPSEVFTVEDFDYLISLLETMKPGLIRDGVPA